MPRMKYLTFIISLIISISLIYALNTKFGDTPPMGKLFNPHSGFWKNAEAIDHSIHIEEDLNSVSKEVKIVFDDNLVPHVFAFNDHDLYFAQGFVTAKLRLWQMEFQMLFASGRLSEIVGEKALNLDKFQRKIGMIWSAKKTLQYVEQDEEMAAVLNAYTDGINYYIENLSARDKPLEYKILDYEPEKWTNLKTILLLNYMSWDLSGYNTDLRLTNILKKFGPEVVKELYTSDDPYMDPIIPPGTEPDFEPVSIPEIPEDAEKALVENQTSSQLALLEPDKDNGSNNWAISGTRSATGKPILANDPHLTLSLPSIWMQIHLVTPEMNVYGVSLQGAPGVIIGFNKKVAWGVTNVDSDVMDWYKIKFKDSTMTEYYHEGRWKNTTKRNSVIKVRGGEDQFLEIIHTHHGPVVFNPGEKSLRPTLPNGAAMKWIAHVPSNVIKTFYLLNRAEDYKDYTSALKYHYCPAQNFIYADNQNNIAIWPNGRFPLKWEGQGKYILDGTNPKHDWQGWIPQEQNPHVKNPERGFVSSANQDVTDSLYPYYLNWEFTTFERGARINDLLEKMENGRADDLRKIQNDNFNLQAEMAVPKFLEILQTKKNMSDLEKQSISMLQNWDYKMGPESIAASIYDALWEFYDKALWADEFSAKDPIMLRPDNTRSLMLLQDSIEAKWFDNIKSPEKEDRSFIVNKSFGDAISYLKDKFGEDIKTWQWGSVKGTNVEHLAKLPGMGTEKLWIGGGHNMVNATKKHKGPSWRMVVELGEEPNAFGIYPGGQSGNPGSPYYANMIDDWASGQLRPLNYIKSADELGEKEIGRIIFTSSK